MKKGPNLPRKFIWKKYFLKFVTKCTYIEFQISRIIFSKYFYQQASSAKYFFLNFHCFFFTESTRMSWSMSKLHHNLKMPKNYLISLGGDKMNIHLGVIMPTQSWRIFQDNSLFLCVTKTSRMVFLDSFFNPSYLWHAFNFSCEKMSTNRFLTFWLLSFGETCLLTVSTYSFE